jgi:hypothetical protein
MMLDNVSDESRQLRDLYSGSHTATVHNPRGFRLSVWLQTSNRALHASNGSHTRQRQSFGRQTDGISWSMSCEVNGKLGGTEWTVLST